MIFPSLLVFRKTSFQCSSVQPIQSRANVRIILSHNSSLNFFLIFHSCTLNSEWLNRTYMHGSKFRAMVMKNTYVAYQTNKNGWSKISPNEFRVKTHPTPVTACINSSSSSE